MNTLLKAIAICTLAISATVTAQTSTCATDLPTFCPTLYNPCCKYLCTKDNESVCFFADVTNAGQGVTCEECPQGLGYIPKVATTSATTAAAAPAETSPSSEGEEEVSSVAEVTTKAIVVAPTGNGTATTLETSLPTGNSTGNGTLIPQPTYISGASSVLVVSGSAILGVFCFMMVL
ncbi:hypothetical protein TWF481_011928 [Arthrobotrys musiformis]|uniref:Uncharacterized protein n=1 Tax=Arthrobotrys musiformis TaxID=47236 RepID=A0AAV9VWL4_9PEZI